MMYVNLYLNRIGYRGFRESIPVGKATVRLGDRDHRLATRIVAALKAQCDAMNAHMEHCVAGPQLHAVGYLSVAVEREWPRLRVSVPAITNDAAVQHSHG